MDTASKARKPISLRDGLRKFQRDCRKAINKKERELGPRKRTLYFNMNKDFDYYK